MIGHFSILGEYGSRESSETLARALSLLLPNSFSPITSSLISLHRRYASVLIRLLWVGPLRWMRERKMRRRELCTLTSAGHWLLCTLTSGDHWLLCTMSYKGLSPAENAGARWFPSPPTTTASPHHRSRAALRRCSSISCSSSEPRLLFARMETGDWAG